MSEGVIESRTERIGSYHYRDQGEFRPCLTGKFVSWFFTFFCFESPQQIGQVKNFDPLFSEISHRTIFFVFLPKNVSERQPSDHCESWNRQPCDQCESWTWHVPIVKTFFFADKCLAGSVEDVIFMSTEGRGFKTRNQISLLGFFLQKQLFSQVT